MLQMNFQYNGSEYITAVWDSFGRTCSYHYAGNVLTAAVDIAGCGSYYFYDGDDRMTRYIRCDGAEFRYAYNASGRCTSTWISGGFFQMPFSYIQTNHPRITVNIDPCGAHETNHFGKRGMLKKTVFCLRKKILLQFIWAAALVYVQ